MTSNSYTGIPSPELNRELDEALVSIGREIGQLHLPGLAGVVLGGGYGRGEGGVLHTENGDKLYNDLDFFVFGDHAGRGTKRAISRALKTVSEKWHPLLGVEVDFSPVKNLGELRRSASTLMFQELLRGWRPVWGDVDPARFIPAAAPEEVPGIEAVRLLLNRGMGLVFAGELLAAGSNDADFIVRNMNKCILGCGDALLLAAGLYRWRLEERRAAFAEYAKNEQMPGEFAAMYADACGWKLEPRPEFSGDPLGSWRECRRFYLDTVRRTAGVPSGAEKEAAVAALRRRFSNARSVKNLLRRVFKSRRINEFSLSFDAPVLTLVGMVFELLEAGETPPVCPEKLRRLWELFN